MIRPFALFGANPYIIAEICIFGCDRALVAQWIELFRPKEEMGVRFPPRAHLFSFRQPAAAGKIPVRSRRRNAALLPVSRAPGISSFPARYSTSGEYPAPWRRDEPSPESRFAGRRVENLPSRIGVPPGRDVRGIPGIPRAL